ncbi:MAG: hypothetical protein MZW92_15000 [Comamonadaceae bacterium]|nr:hypothetical protein [Comamonadaceae bacterium]
MVAAERCSAGALRSDCRASWSRCSARLFGHRIDYGDLYFQYSRSEGWSLEEGIVKSGSFNIEQGVGVRAISGEKTAFAYSDDIIACRRSATAAAATRAIAAAGAERQMPMLRGAGDAAPAAIAPADPLASLDDAAKVRAAGAAGALRPRRWTRA